MNCQSKRNRPGRSWRQRGFVLVTMTAAAMAMLGAMGLAVDLGRIFIVKNEVQNYADAEALAAALQLNGTSTGITNAINAVTSSASTYNFSSTDRWNFNTCSHLSSTAACTAVTPTAEFATAPTGATWYSSAAAVSAAGVAYTAIDNVRVTTSVSVPLYFLPVVMTTKTYTTTVNAKAIGGQVAITNFSKGLAPFTAVASSPTGPFFGMTVGQEYDIQWPQYNSTRNGCNNGHPEKCFNSPPCAGDLADINTLREVTNYWGSNINGYWGYSATSNIRDSILGTLQLQAVAVGTDIQPVLSNGNKAAVANYLDDRVNSDPINTGNVFSTYQSTPGHNGRRLIVVPVVMPAANGTGVSTSYVQGYGQFFLETNATGNGNNTTSDYYTKVNGNDPFCAIYAGPFDLGSIDPGAGGSSTGASRVRLVE